MSRKGASSGVLATKLYPQLASSRANLFFSPYSVAIVLATCQTGASGETRAEIEAALGVPGAGDALLEAFGELRKVLESRARPAPEPFELSVASSLWRQADYRLSPSFVASVQEKLRVDLREADLAGEPAEAVRQVNAWVEGVTRGKISEILGDSDLGPLARAILVNAVYFKAPWLNQFDEELTRLEPFHLLDSRTVNVPMMHRTLSLSYARGKRFQALEVPYGNDWVVMQLILPDAGRFEDVERSVDFTADLELTRRARPVDVKLSLPRFRIEMSADLSQPLKSVGVESAFSTSADFTRLSEEPGFSLDRFLHKAIVEVDERGTEAAAVTAMLVLGASPRRPPPPIEFRVDRPFLFVIADKPTGTVLFVGRVLDPRTDENPLDRGKACE